MAKLNWSRLLLGTLLAAVICFVSDGLLHNKIVDQQWRELFVTLRGAQPEAEHAHDPLAFLYFAIFELGRGFIALFVYALLRERTAARGPKTALVAGAVSWFAFSLTGPVQMMPLGLFSGDLWLRMAAFQLVASLLATLAGAAIYKEGARGTAA